MSTTAPQRQPALASSSPASSEAPSTPPELEASLDIDWEACTPGGFYPRHGHRLLDLTLLLFVLPVAFVPGLIIAVINLAVFRDPRRIFFVQQRIGYRGRAFSIMKFRTMREATTDSMDSWTGGQDVLRVTRFGRFLRNAHLDELPQLFNVLRGDMSFIGPRPEMVEIEHWANDCVPGFSERLALRPGITGYAQITQGYTGCDPKAYAMKCEINQLYLHRISLRTDLEIIARTAKWMVCGKGWQWQPSSQPSPPPAASSADAASAAETRAA